MQRLYQARALARLRSVVGWLAVVLDRLELVALALGCKAQDSHWMFVFSLTEFPQ